MTDNADRWRNVAQAAQWLAEGREVEFRWIDPMNRRGGDPEWQKCDDSNGNLWGCTLRNACEYRLKPKPPKPREWVIEYGFDDLFRLICIIEGPGPSPRQRIRVREVIE